MSKFFKGSEVTELKKWTGTDGIIRAVGTIKDENGYNPVKVWADNPEEIDVNLPAVIQSIRGGSRSRKPLKSDAEKYYYDFSINATLANVKHKTEDENGQQILN